MADSGGTMLDMVEKRSKPQDKRGRGRPSQGGRSAAYIVYARIDTEIGAALDAYVKATEPEPKFRAVIELALKKLLGEAGFWPPAEPK